jgi:hypothetical protein
MIRKSQSLKSGIRINTRKYDTFWDLPSTNSTPISNWQIRSHADPATTPKLIQNRFHILLKNNLNVFSYYINH